MDATEKQLSVLDALDGGSSLGDIAARAQLPKSTVHRILGRLVERGYARAEGSGVYGLGRAFVDGRRTAGPARRRDVRAADPARAARGGRAHHAPRDALRRRGRLPREAGRPESAVQFASRVVVGYRWHCTAIGKSLLGGCRARGARAARPPQLVRRTPRTLVSPAEIEANSSASASAARDRRRGGEREIRCVGSAVRDHRGVPTHAISVSALTVEVSFEDALTLGPRVGRRGRAAVAAGARRARGVLARRRGARRRAFSDLHGGQTCPKRFHLNESRFRHMEDEEKGGARA